MSTSAVIPTSLYQRARRLLGPTLLASSVLLFAACGESSSSDESPLSAQTPGSGAATQPTDQIPPEAGVVFRYAVDEPVTYLVNSTSRLGMMDRGDMKQIYRSTARVTYEPIKRDAIPERIMSRPFRDNPTVSDEAHAQDRVLVTVEAVHGQFDQPEGLDQVERSHQLLRQAVFSYALSPGGRIEDVQLHEPINPLARGSMARMIRLAESIRTVFPDHPVNPGDSWTQEIPYRDRGGQVQASEDLVNKYTFEEWRPCRGARCAYISIEQSIKSAARLDAAPHLTKASATGTGEGWMLFDPEKGQIVKTYWRLRSEGKIDAQQARKDGDPLSAQARVRVEVESTTERIDVAPEDDGVDSAPLAKGNPFRGDDMTGPGYDDDGNPVASPPASDAPAAVDDSSPSDDGANSKP